MQERGKVISVFLVLFIISLILFALSSSGVLRFNFISNIFSPTQKEIHDNSVQLSKSGLNPEIEKLREENRLLAKKLIDQQKLVAQNKALLDQFQQVNIKSLTLLPAEVIGSPGFIPGISFPEFLVLNRGLSENVKEGDPVVFKDNLIGKITKVSENTSLVNLIGNNSFSLAAKVGQDKKALGVIKGQGEGNMILDNVLLSETLKNGDIVLTNGDVNQNAEQEGDGGLPPDLIIGKIISVDKNPSALFQKANVVSFVDFSKLSTVFIQIQE